MIPNFHQNPTLKPPSSGIPFLGHILSCSYRYSDMKVLTSVSFEDIQNRKYHPFLQRKSYFLFKILSNSQNAKSTNKRNKIIIPRIEIVSGFIFTQQFSNLMIFLLSDSLNQKGLLLPQKQH